MSLQKYKIVLVGNAGVGKSSFINYHLDNVFNEKYIPTYGADIYSICFDTNYGKIVFDIWDIAGQELFSGLCDGYYAETHGIIGLFDTTSRISLRYINKWVTDVKNISGEIPTVICGTKCDIEERYPCPNYNILSSKNNINMDLPFILLARQLTGYTDLIFFD
jgi:GTP-binding nuclear protein Ran